MNYVILTKVGIYRSTTVKKIEEKATNLSHDDNVQLRFPSHVTRLLTLMFVKRKAPIHSVILTKVGINRLTTVKKLKESNKLIT